MIRRTIRSPALHFLCLGALLLAATRAWDGPGPLPADVSDEELLSSS